MATDTKPDASKGGNGAYAPPADAADITALFIKSDQGDPLTTVTLHRIPVGRPKDFFRTVPDPAYRERAEIYVHKAENSSDETVYIIGPALHEQIQEANPCILVTVIDRLGNPRIWPIKTAKPGGKEQAAWTTSLAIAKTGLTHWVRMVWVNNSTGYLERKAEEGYAPEPDFSKLPPFDQLSAAAFPKAEWILDKNHVVYRNLFGLATPSGATKDDPFA
jgi:hypothetical protein